jgi:hypothetical protein
MMNDFRKWQRKSVSLDSIDVSPGVMTAHVGNGLMMTSPANPTTDLNRMSASATINTDAVDYEDEVILASGVRIGNYQNNPVVLWDHGKSITTLPIGTCRMPDGDIDLIRSDRSIDSTTYFAQSLPFAHQVFGLIDEGVVRATSIHVVPYQVAAYRAPDGREVMVTEDCDMVEWSWTCLGVNPEAVRKEKSFRMPDRYCEAWALQMDRAASVLNKGTLGGDILSPSIRKSLMSLAKPKGMLINPFGESQDADMTKKTLTGPEIRKIGRVQLKSMKLEEYDEATQAKMKALMDDEETPGMTDDTPPTNEMPEGKEKSKVPPQFEADDEEAEEVPVDPKPKANPKAKAPSVPVEPEATEEVAQVETEEGDEGELTDDAEAKSMPTEQVVPDSENELVDGPQPIKPGAKVLKEAHDAVDYVVKYLQSAMAPLENQAVVAGLTAELEALVTSVDAIRGLFAAEYPDQPALGVAAEQTADDVVNEQIKSMLAARQRDQFRVLGLQSLVANVAKEKNLTVGQRKSLLAVQQKFTGMLEQAANHKPEVPAGYVPESQYIDLQNRFVSLLEKTEAALLPASVS